MTISLRSLVNPTPKQKEFLEAIKQHQYVLYGGAAGSGKSYILRWTLVALLLKWAKELRLRGVRAGLFCEDYPALRDRHLSKVRYEFPPWLGKLKEQFHEFHLAERFGGGVICFRNLDDPSKYLSSEFAAIAVDELTRNSREVFDILRMRLRWPGIERPVFVAATNPGGIGHAWVKRLWIDREFDEELQPLAHEFAYIPALPHDNPYLSQSYITALESLPENLRRAYLHGDWAIFEGQVFDEFRRDIHVVEPFEIPRWWHRWLANDPGYADHFAWYWLTADQDGNVYVYREYTNAEAQRVTYSEQAARVAELSAGERLNFCVTGMDAWNRHPETGKSIIDYYREGGLEVGFVRPVHGPESRKLRTATLHEYLKPYLDRNRDKQTARLRIFDTCVKLIETLPMLTADPNDPEVVAKSSIDHYYDALTYGLCAWHASHSLEPPPARKPLPWPLRDDTKVGGQDWWKW